MWYAITRSQLKNLVKQRSVIGEHHVNNMITYSTARKYWLTRSRFCRLPFAACRGKGFDAELPHLLAVTPRSTESGVQTDAIIKTIAYWKFGFSPTPPISLIYIISQSLNNTAVSDFGLFVRLSLPYLQHTQIPSSHVKFCVYYYSSYGQIVCSHWRSSISRLVCQWHIFLEFLKMPSYSISTYRDTLDIA